ncbi:hypothetical protein B3286c1_0674 [Brucella vulpis]|nr:hypothetical protein BF3285c1_0675 [Brucella vulpis]CUW49506.1 hypothetical protein B3286c1_0674 [Brucella vulpis]
MAGLHAFAGHNAQMPYFCPPGLPVRAGALRNPLTGVPRGASTGTNTRRDERWETGRP